MDFEMKKRIGFGFEKPKSVHLCQICSKMAVIAWPDSMTPVESTRVTIFGDSTRLESR